MTTTRDPQLDCLASNARKQKTTLENKITLLVNSLQYTQKTCKAWFNSLQHGGTSSTARDRAFTTRTGTCREIRDSLHWNAHAMEANQDQMQQAMQRAPKNRRPSRMFTETGTCQWTSS